MQLCHFESISQTLFQEPLRVQQLFWIILFMSSLLSLCLGPDNCTQLLGLDLIFKFFLFPFFFLFFSHCSLFSALYSMRCATQKLSLLGLLAWVYKETQQLGMGCSPLALAAQSTAGLG